MERKTEIGRLSTYLAPEVKVIPLMTQRAILEVSTGETPVGFPEIPTGPGV